MDGKNNKNIAGENTGESMRSFGRFWIGVLIGLGGWVIHAVIHAAFTYFVMSDHYFGFWGSLALIGMFFFIFGWEAITIIAGIISVKKGAKKAVSFVSTIVLILSFVAGGCAGLMNN